MINRSAWNVEKIPARLQVSTSRDVLNLYAQAWLFNSHQIVCVVKNVL